MAGGGKYPALLVDPAIEKWYHMKENTAYNLRLNKRLVGIGGIFLFAIPGFVYYLSKKYNGTFKFKGATRGEQIYFPNE